MKNEYKILGLLETEFGRRSLRLEGNIKINLKQGCEYVDWLHLTQAVSVVMVMNFRVSQKVESYIRKSLS
jgi:hypothetical protein